MGFVGGAMSRKLRICGSQMGGYLSRKTKFFAYMKYNGTN